MASSTPASPNSGSATTAAFGAGATTESGRRCSRAGGIERAGSDTATRTGATCFVGSGDGIGARRTGTDAPCVERAGVEARDLETAVRRAGFERALLRPRAGAGRDLFAALGLERWDVRRALALCLEDAAFNCFPLSWILTPALR